MLLSWKKSSIGTLQRIIQTSRSSSYLQNSLFSTTRDYEYFDNFEVKDGVGLSKYFNYFLLFFDPHIMLFFLVRFNGPNKMNTISQGFQKEAEEIIMKHVVGNKDIKAIVFISSKNDNFIAGADIDMVCFFD